MPVELYGLAVGGAGGGGGGTSGVDLTLAGNTAGVLALMSSGTVTFAGGNNITLSQNGNAVTISGPNAGGVPFGISAGSQSVSSGTVIFANSNNITFGMSGSTQVTASFSTIPQTVQTQNLIDVTVGGNTSGGLALISSGTMTLAGGNNITLSQVGNAVTISAGGGGTAATGISSIVASNTTYTSGQVIFIGSNMVTVKSGAGQSVVIDATQTVQTQNVVDVTIGGFTSGTSTLISSGTMILAGGNNITLSQVGNAITISGPNTTATSVQTQNLFDLTLSGNTSGVLALVSSGTLTLAGGNNITLSQAGNAITISAAGGLGSFSWTEVNGPAPAGEFALTGASVSHRPIFQPFGVQGTLQVNTLRLLFDVTSGSTLNCTIGVGIYSMSNSTKLNIIGSTTHAYSLTNSTQFSGLRIYDFTGMSSVTLTQGQYVMGFNVSASNTSTAVANLAIPAYPPQGVLGVINPGTNSTGTAGTFLPWLGVLASTSGALPSTVGSVDLLGGSSYGQQLQYYAQLRMI